MININSGSGFEISLQRRDESLVFWFGIEVRGKKRKEKEALGLRKNYGVRTSSLGFGSKL